MTYPKKGWVMYCTKCNKDLFRFKKDIQAGDSPDDSTLEVIGDQRRPDDGEIMKCSFCGHHIQLDDYREGKQHGRQNESE